MNVLTIACFILDYVKSVGKKVNNLTLNALVVLVAYYSQTEYGDKYPVCLGDVSFAGITPRPMIVYYKFCGYGAEYIDIVPSYNKNELPAEFRESLCRWLSADLGSDPLTIHEMANAAWEGMVIHNTPEKAARPERNWEDYADEHVLLMRPLDPVCPCDYECIHAMRDWEDTDCVIVRHEVIFGSDYDFNNKSHIRSLNDLMRNFGYDSFDDFVLGDREHVNWVYQEDGGKDRVNTPEYIVDYALLCSLICESHSSPFADGSIRMSEKDALAFIEKLTGVEYQLIPGSR